MKIFKTYTKISQNAQALHEPGSQVRTFFHLWSQPDQSLSFKHSSSIAIPDHEPTIKAGLYIYRLRRRERCAEAGTAAANAAVAPEADTSELTDDSEFRTAIPRYDSMKVRCPVVGLDNKSYQKWVWEV